MDSHHGYYCVAPAMNMKYIVRILDHYFLPSEDTLSGPITFRHLKYSALPWLEPLGGHLPCALSSGTAWHLTPLRLPLHKTVISMTGVPQILLRSGNR